MNRNVLLDWRSCAGLFLLSLTLALWAQPVSGQNSLSSIVAANSAANLLTNGGFETMKPAYWAPTGVGAEWSTEQARTPGWSLKLSGGGDNWVMAEAVRSWVGGIPAGGTPEIVIGGWVYTDGVNTAPADDDAKFQLVFEFFDVPGGTDVLGAPVVLDLPQAAASSGGWVELSSATLGAIALPSEKAATSVRVTFRQGANATGTAYLDDLFIKNAEGADGWAGDWFNANMDAGDTWYYWWDGFSQGGDFPTAQTHFQYVTSAEAHSGTNSLLIESNGTNDQETVAVSDRVPVTAGEPVLFSYWVKREGNTDPGTIGTGENNLGMIALWYDNMTGGAAGFGELGGVDINLSTEGNEQLIPHLTQVASSGWEQYAFVAYPMEGAVAVEMRIRYSRAFDGVTYWDDVVIVPLGGSSFVNTAIEDEMARQGKDLPETFQLHQNYPNPFNPSTTISFDLASNSRVTLDVYNVLGQRVKSLIANVDLSAGSHMVTFDASTLTSGVYLYMLRADGRSAARQMVLLK
jgi:hypothetical protein